MFTRMSDFLRNNVRDSQIPGCAEPSDFRGNRKLPASVIALFNGNSASVRVRVLVSKMWSVDLKRTSHGRLGERRVGNTRPFS